MLRRIGKRALVLVALVLVALVAVLGLSGVPLDAPDALAADSDDIVDPDPFVWTYVDAPEPHYVGVIEYGEATFTMNNGDTLTTRAYRQEGSSYSIPGPTLNMVPGTKYVVRFRNLLPYEAPSSDMNTFKDPNITNLHTHGLHISGEGSGDDVTRMFEGGFGGDYIYDIPADHMGGTYWYHAHHHGSTFLQVSTGGFGLIVIDDGQDQIPANVAAMEERNLVIGYLNPGAAGTGGDVLISGTLDPGWTVNGKVNGTLTVPPDTWQHWRILLADTDARSEDVTVGAGCETRLLARDGVWRTTAPKDLPTNTVNLTGASRADLAVRCTGTADIRVGKDTVANIVVAGTADPGPHPYAADGVSTWSAVRPSYLRDLSAETNLNTESVSIGARTINNDKFDGDVPTFTLNADAVQEWTLSGATNHPFHLHVYHMQTFGCGGDFEDGEYYDTVAGDCTVRFDLNAATSSPYAGRTIMHCHILGHEDRGAMGWVDLIGGTPPPTFPAGQGYADYYALPSGSPTAPSDLVATPVTNSEMDLTWIDESNDEVIFTVERSLDGVGFAWLASIPADTNAFLDSTVMPDTTYWYRIRAANAAGVSTWSNAASATTPVPVLEPGSFGAPEGDSGETVFHIPITLSEASNEPITIDYVSWPCTVYGGCGDGIATEGVDYESLAPGTLTFLPGETEKSVPVTVYGDTDVEPRWLWGEWFLIRFLDPSPNAELDISVLGLGFGVIGDDDP